MLIVGELCLLLNLTSGNRESLEDLLDVGTRLHRNNSKLILLINPHKESLVVVVEDSSSLWPVSFKTARLEIFITSLEKEMVCDQLLLLTLGHLGEGEILTSKVSSKFGKS